MTSAVEGSLNELSAAEAYEDEDENEDRKEG